RSRVLEYLNEVRGKLPEGVNPTLGPDASGVGWVYEYALVDDRHQQSLQELRALQDWNLRYAVASVQGVADVATVGAFEKEVQVVVDPVKLQAYGIALRDVVQAVRDSNQEVGGQVMEVAQHEFMVRGRGYVKDRADLARVPLRTTAMGAPVTLADV